MRIPFEISPNPIIISTIEIRFYTDLESSDMLPLIYAKVMKDLPKLSKENELPKEIKNKDPMFVYLPDYILSNDDYLLSFSNRAISFEHIGEYKGWENYFPFIKKQLLALFELNFIQEVGRIGVRYGNIFDKKENINDVLEIVPSFLLNNLTESFQNHKSLFKHNDNIYMLLQAVANAKSIKNGKSRSGVYVDIDAFNTEVLLPSIEVFDKIDTLHSLGKELFFKLLKPSFIDTLNPKYR